MRLRKLTSLTALAAALASSVPALCAQGERVGQLYSYTIKDRPAFEDGYRRHLRWHAVRKDQLVWYAWIVDSGPRKGTFVDGTFGATFLGLDARPDPAADSADFAHNVSPYVTALDVETWTLWAPPSIATPLEDRQPGAILDVFLFQVDPAQAPSFEAGMERLAMTKREVSKLTWYRVVRGYHLPTYALLLMRKNLADMEAAGPALDKMLANAYGQSATQIAGVLRTVRTMHVETWSYEPRLALIPGQPLAP